MTIGADPGVRGKLEAIVHFSLHEQGGTLIALVLILVKNRSMMLERVLAALNHNGQQRTELSVGVVGIVCVSWSLRSGQHRGL